MTTNSINPGQANLELLEEIEKAGINTSACYQCGRCSAGCPVSDFFDLMPMEIVRLSSYGMQEELIASKTIWLCASCETCTTRCPNDIEIAHLMDVLRQWVIKQKHPVSEPNILAFHQSFLGSVKHWGRVFEIGMIGAYKFRTGDFFSDLGLGVKMLARNKLHFLPHSIKGKQELKDIFKESSEEQP